MKIIINASTFKGTGVTQVAVSFINECINFPENEYVIFMSPNVAANIQQEIFPSNFTFYIFGKYSLYGLRGIPDILKMKRIEADCKPDAVFSVFGPSLWRPKAPHLQGYAFPHYVYTESPAFSIMTVKERVGVTIRRIVHIAHMKYEGKFFVSETHDVSRRLHEKYKINEEKLFTVSNTANSYFLNYKKSEQFTKHEGEYRFYSLCSNSPHKNLVILNKVIPLLQKHSDSVKIVFYVTIPSEDYEKLFSEEVKPFIVNKGPLKVADCPAFVESCDAMFLPTLLECFSASYPEAMLMGKPILTSNLTFATTVCGDAAIYFDPLNAEDVAEKITMLANSQELADKLVDNGKKQLSEFLSPRERAEAYLKICKYISAR